MSRTLDDRTGSACNTARMKRHRDVELISSELLHSGRIFDVRRESARLPSGLVQTLDVVDHPGAVGIAAHDDRGRLLVVKQYRHATGDWQIEIPAGRLEIGEDPLIAAQRELEEETGFRAERWELWRTLFLAPGFCSERMWIYRAGKLAAQPGGGLAADDDEELTSAWMEPAAILADPCNQDAKTLLVAALASADGPESRTP